MGGASGWQFWIDRGGTFTDCIGIAPDGRVHVHKLLSSDEAPVVGVRAILEQAGALAPGAPVPPCRVRLGSTVATNALLERRGAPTVWVTHEGLGDVITIGTQERPALFDLRIERPVPLARAVIECGGRVAADGSPVSELDEAALARRLEAARAEGATSVAITG